MKGYRFCFNYLIIFQIILRGFLMFLNDIKIIIILNFIKQKVNMYNIYKVNINIKKQGI